MPKILIGTPNFTCSMHTLVAGKFMECYAAWKNEFGYDNVRWTIVPRQFVHFARNKIAKTFIEEDFDYLFWLDDDAVANVDLLPAMMKHMQNEDVGVVIAPYFMRRGPHAIGVLRCEGGNLDYVPDYKNIDIQDLNQGLIEVDGGGTHCMLVKRKIMEAVPEPWFRLPPLGGTEDMYFCLKVRKLGYKIHCDTDLEVPHIGDSHIVTRSYREAWVKKHGTQKTMDQVVTQEDLKKGYISIDADFADGSEQLDGFTNMAANAAAKKNSMEQAT